MLSHAEPREEYLARGLVRCPLSAADTFRTHAKLRARIQLPLSLRALAVVLPHVARSLPLRWSLRLLGALAKVMDQLPKAPPQPLTLTLPMTLTR